MSAALMCAAILYATCLQAAPLSSKAARMRPYTGIGVLMLAISSSEDSLLPAPLQLYGDPAIYRLGELKIATIPPYEWIFGQLTESVPLIVMAHKGEWLRVVYDDAGREGWVNPRRVDVFQPWETFFTGRAGRMLPGLQKRYYQLFREPGSGPLATLNPRQPFVVTMLDDDWIHLAMSDQSVEGWVRWRDPDGRLLVGLEREAGVPKQRQ